LEAGEEGFKEKKREFVDNLINDFANLYTAGTDTTEHATMMMVYFIHKFPGVKERLMKELQEHSVNPDDLKYESIKNLTYLEAICFETLRLYQTANGIFPREVLSPVTIRGVTLSTGTVLKTQTFPVHFSKSIYEDPEEFRPERWLDKDGRVKAAPAYCFNSFSYGIRGCIGKQLALQEMKMFTVFFSMKFECEFETLDFKLNMCGFAYEPQPIKMKFWEKC
jgi:cytochrome P450